jgi:hypothetical protein
VVRVETLHAPHGREVEPYVCPKCYASFEALFLFRKHVRDAHGDKLPMR